MTNHILSHSMDNGVEGGTSVSHTEAAVIGGRPSMSSASKKIRMACEVCRYFVPEMSVISAVVRRVLLMKDPRQLDFDFQVVGGDRDPFALDSAYIDSVTLHWPPLAAQNLPSL